LAVESSIGNKRAREDGKRVDMALVLILNRQNRGIIGKEREHAHGHNSCNKGGFRSIRGLPFNMGGEDLTQEIYGVAGEIAKLQEKGSDSKKIKHNLRKVRRKRGMGFERKSGPNLRNQTGGTAQLNERTPEAGTPLTRRKSERRRKKVPLKRGDADC